MESNSERTYSFEELEMRLPLLEAFVESVNPECLNNRMKTLKQLQAHMEVMELVESGDASIVRGTPDTLEFMEQFTTNFTEYFSYL